MVELLIAGGIGVYGHLKSKDFVHKRLRFTKFVERPYMGLFAGAATAIAVGAVAPVIPLVGAAAAIATGVGVGTGVAVGSTKARQGPPDDDEF